MNNIEKVYEIFKEFFGEDKVDLANNEIIVFFPKVTVTNEHNRSIDIAKLFVKTIVSTEGTILEYPLFVRSEYTKEQLDSGYLHSHCPSITLSEIAKPFMPCLGSGPIRGTISSLETQFDEDMWRLYCYELSLYVTRESLSGGPYIKLETVGHTFRTTRQRDEDLTYLISQNDSFIPEFYSFVVKSKKIPFNFINGNYSIALSPYILTITLSNLFIEWYNKLSEKERSKLNTELWSYAKCENGKIYTTLQNSSTDYYSVYIGTPIIKFKGVEYKLEITDYKKPQNIETLPIIVTTKVRNAIIHELLHTVNFKLREHDTIKSKTRSFDVILSEDTRVL